MGEVAVALDPSELVDMDKETLQERYEQELEAARPESERENVSDLMDEHFAKESKKRKQAQAKKANARDKNIF